MRRQSKAQFDWLIVALFLTSFAIMTFAGLGVRDTVRWAWHQAGNLNSSGAMTQHDR
jgi:hypothetical protein